MNDSDVAEYIRDLWKESYGDTTKRDRTMIASYIWGFWRNLKKTENYVSEDDMCVNCVTPWKCNGPHIPEPPKAVCTTCGKVKSVCCDEGEGYAVVCKICCDGTGHGEVDEPFMVTITVNGVEAAVPAHSYLDYDAVVLLGYGKVEPYMTVVFSSEKGDGSLWQGGPLVKPVEKMHFTAVHTGNA